MMIGAVVPVKDEYALDIKMLHRELDAFCDRVAMMEGGTLADAYRAGDANIPADWWTIHVDIGSHRITDVVRVMDNAVLDVTIGSRFCTGGRFVGPWHRKARSLLAASLINTISPGRHIHDWTSGLRVYSPKAREVIRKHQFTTEGHAWQIESLWACLEAGLRVDEVPITYRAGHSHMNAARAWEAAKLWARLAF